jgi:hypothetical protein
MFNHLKLKSMKTLTIETLEERHEMSNINPTGPIKWPPPFFDDWNLF